MTWNLVKTALAGKAVNGTAQVVDTDEDAREKDPKAGGIVAVLTGRPLVLFLFWVWFVLFSSDGRPHARSDVDGRHCVVGRNGMDIGQTGQKEP